MPAGMGSQDPVAGFNNAACSDELAHTGPLRTVFKCISCKQHRETTRSAAGNAEVRAIPVRVFGIRVARQPLDDFVPNAPSRVGQQKRAYSSGVCIGD